MTPKLFPHSRLQLHTHTFSALLCAPFDLSKPLTCALGDLPATLRFSEFSKSSKVRLKGFEKPKGAQRGAEKAGAHYDRREV